MGIPWIKAGKIDKDKLPKFPFTFRDYADGITFEQACQIIADYINEMEEEKEKARERVKKYEEEINADVRVQELTASLEELQGDLRRGFKITESETKAIQKWKDKHDIEQHGLDTNNKKLRAGGAIGGRYSYEFYPTSIGTAGVCVCNRCRRKAMQVAKGEYEEYVQLKKELDAEFEFCELG